MSELLHPEETITRLLLIRHGHTRATEAGRLYSDPQAPLTERGQQQAQQAAEWVKSQKPDVLLSSPALRVRSSANIIGAALETQPIVVDGLDEWRIGDWEGRTYLDLKQNEPQLYKDWSEDPIHNAPPGGESICDLFRRVSGQLSELLGRYEGKQVVLVSHAGVIRSILVHALEMKVENFWRISVPTGSISRIDFSQNFATVQFTGFCPGAHPAD